jgi:predicted nucleic acid-binding protein
LTLVVDSSAVVAFLVDSGEVGAWVEGCVADEQLAAPHLMPVEAANILRRAELAGEVSSDVGALALEDLLDLPIDYYPFEPVGYRVWQLRPTVTTYDAWYVALAESLEAPLVTLDRRLTTAAGPLCVFRTPV